MADSPKKIVREATVEILEMWVDAFDNVLMEFGADNPQAAVAAALLVVNGAREFIDNEKAKA